MLRLLGVLWCVGDPPLCPAAAAVAAAADDEEGNNDDEDEDNGDDDDDSNKEQKNGMLATTWYNVSLMKPSWQRRRLHQCHVGRAQW